jgi:ATP-dependent protease Clp ATPase subunit
MEQFMMKLMYELPSDELAETVTITRDFIQGKGEAIVTHRAPALPEAEPMAQPEPGEDVTDTE